MSDLMYIIHVCTTSGLPGPVNYINVSCLGPFNNYIYLRGQDEGGGGQKMSDFVHAQGIKTVHAGGGGGGKKWQNSVHVVVECPLCKMRLLRIPIGIPKIHVLPKNSLVLRGSEIEYFSPSARGSLWLCYLLLDF